MPYPIFQAMNTTKVSPTSPIIRSLALAALGAALILAIAPRAAVAAAVNPTAYTLSDKAPSLPLKATFEKVTSGENEGLYNLNLQNTSDASVTVTATILVSVPVHNQPKTRTMPAETIEAGKTWTIEGLASMDKVTLTAEGYAPMEVIVP